MTTTNTGVLQLSYTDVLINHLYPGTVTITYPYNISFQTDKVGVSNPKWREAVKNGTDAGSPYSFKKTWASCGRQTIKTRRMLGNKLYMTTERSGAAITDNVPSLMTGAKEVDSMALLSVRGAAVAKFYSKASSAVTPLKGLVVLGELKKTLRLLAGALLTGMKALLALQTDVRAVWAKLRRELSTLSNRQQRRAAVKRALKDVSDQYLQFTFGIQPLLNDIESFLSVIADRGIRREVIRVSVKSQTISVEDHKWNTLQSSGDITSDLTKTVKIKSRVVGVVEWERPGVSVTNITARDLGLSLREVVPALWELLPYSFLIDYFVNVSDVLNTVFYADMKFVYAWTSTKYDQSYVYRLNGVTGKGGFTVDRADFGAPLSIGVIYFERVETNPFQAGIRVRLPPIGRKWLNIFALTAQRLLR